MEKLEGEDFSRVIDRGDLPEKKLERLILGALDGLGTAHKLGLVHKDLKPQNLFLAEDISGERLVVIDYGFGRRLGREADRLTQSGKIGGSPSYLPPEYIEEYNVCPQNDVYQMALIIIEAFTGEKVVNHEGVWEAISAHLNGELRVPDSFKQHRWYPVVLQALDRDLAVRFADANVFAENLKQQEEPTQDPTTPPVLKSKHLRFETTETTCELTNTAETNVFAYILTVAAACAVVVSFWFTAWIWTLTAAVATFVAIGAILFVDSDCQKIRVSDFDVVVTRKKPRRYPLVDVKSFNVSKRGVIMKVGWKSVPILQSLNADDALKVAHYLNATLERLRAS